MGILDKLNPFKGITFFVGDGGIIDLIRKNGTVLPPVEQWTDGQKIMLKPVITTLADELHEYSHTDEGRVKLHRLITNGTEGCTCEFEIGKCPYKVKYDYMPVVVCRKELENRDDPNFVCFMRIHMYNAWERTAAYLEKREGRQVYV